MDKNCNCFRLVGDLSGKVTIILPLILEGQAEIVTQDISFYMESAMEKTANGAPRVRSLLCEAKIGKIDITNHNGGLAGIAVNTFKVGQSTRLCNKKRAIDHNRLPSPTNCARYSKPKFATEQGRLLMLS